MAEPGTPEVRTHVKVVAIARLRKIKQALEAKTSRLSPGAPLMVSSDYEEELHRSLLDLQRVGVEIPQRHINHDGKRGNDERDSGNQILTSIDRVLGRIEAKPEDPPTWGS